MVRPQDAWDDPEAGGGDLAGLSEMTSSALASSRMNSWAQSATPSPLGELRALDTVALGAGKPQTLEPAPQPPPPKP